MVLQKPTVEFVKIDLINASSTSIQCDQTTTKKGSIETCTGPDAPSNTDCSEGAEI